MKLLGIFTTFILLTSCQDLRKDKQIQSVDKLATEVETIQKEYLDKKNDTIGRLIPLVMDVEFRIRRNFVSDTIAKVLGVKINAYKQVRKRVKPLGKMYVQLDKGTKEELETLKKLKSDIESDLGEHAKYQEYINFEKKKVGQLAMVLEQMIIDQNYCIETFNKYHQELNDFSWTLIKNKK